MDKIVCFTGHRPNKLGGYNWHTPKNLEICRALRDLIKRLIDEGYNKFLCGGALGIDQMSFEILLKLKNEYNPNIKLVLAIPYEKQWIVWFNLTDKDRWRRHIQLSDEVIYVDTLKGTRYECDLNGYGVHHVAKLDLRNQYMVDNADLVVAVWNGNKGGTGNCVKYAEKLDKSIIRLDPNTLETVNF